MHNFLRGSVDSRFTAARETFTDLLRSGAETGAAVAAYVDGVPVVDLWGGWADAARTRPWQRDTLCTTYSVSKPFAAVAALRRVAAGDLGLDDPLTRHWPEYAAHGKGATTLRHALAHQAGVPALDRDEPVETLLDPVRFAAAVAATVPEWEPGTAHGEHATTYGALLAEPVRRESGRTLGRILRDEVTGPLGIDVSLGVATGDLPRVAEVEYAEATWPGTAAGPPGSLWHRAITRPAGGLDASVVNGTGFRSAEIGAINLHATARGIARFYSSLLETPARVLPASLLAEALAPQAVGTDRLLERHVSWTLGFQRDDDGFLGMGGIGGSAGYVHGERGLAFAYVTRRLGDHARADAVAAAVESCL